MDMLKMGSSKVVGPFLLLAMVPVLPFCVAGATAMFVLEKSGIRPLKKSGVQFARFSHKMGNRFNTFAEECAQSLNCR